jgi:hypothetical protein
MSTIVRRKRASRNIGPFKRHELLSGEIFYSPPAYYSGYGDGQSSDLSAFISDAMRTDWEQNRDELLKFWRSGKDTAPDIFPDSLPWMFVRGEPGTLPWAALQFDVEPKGSKRPAAISGSPQSRSAAVMQITPEALVNRGNDPRADLRDQPYFMIDPRSSTNDERLGLGWSVADGKATDTDTQRKQLATLLGEASA